MGYVASFRYMTDVNSWITYWGHSKDDFTIEKKTNVQPLANALHNCKAIINRILGEVDHTSYQLYLSPTKDSAFPNFREEIAVTHKYKGKRKNKPRWYKEIRNYLINEWGAEVCAGQEADDALGIEQMRIINDRD